MIIIFLITQYLLFALLQWYYTKLAYSKNGKWSNIKPDITDIIVMVIPILNVFSVIGFLFFYPIRKTNNHRIKINHNIMNQFFNIKK